MEIRLELGGKEGRDGLLCNGQVLELVDELWGGGGGGGGDMPVLH